MKDPVPQPHIASKSTSQVPVPRIGTGKKLLFAAFICFAVFAIAEGLLRCLWTPPPPLDPFVGFSKGVPLLAEQSGEETNHNLLIGFHPSKLVWFNQQTFPARKPPNTFRIVCLGGSTTFGRPFDDQTSFCGWLRIMLPMINPELQWEVINAGGVSYASYRVARVMEEFIEHDVDLFILYTGQNEFLEHRTYGDLMDSSDVPRIAASWASRTHVGKAVNRLVEQWRDTNRNRQELSHDVDEILNHSIGPSSYQYDPQWYRGVETHLQVNLDRMKMLADRVDSKLVVVGPVSNLRDCSPFKSNFRNDPDDESQEKSQQRLARARRLIADGEADRAWELLQQLADAGPGNADADYLLGRLAFSQNRFTDARSHFLEAIDHDICPLRATSRIRQIIQAFGTQPEVIYVDFESVLANQLKTQAGHDCFGAETFLDHVHPTIDAHRDLAIAILDELRGAGLINEVPSTQQINNAQSQITNAIDGNAQGAAFRNLAKVTHWAGKFEEAIRHAMDALRLLPGDLESHYVLADSLAQTGNPDAAIQQYTELFLQGDFDRACLPFGELLARSGHYDAAKAYLMQAVMVSEGTNKIAAYRSLGQLHEHLGEIELAEECFELAESLQ